MPTSLNAIQEALLVLIMRVAKREMTEHKFFEAMESWERCFRNTPDKNYSGYELIKIATQGYL